MADGRHEYGMRATKLVTQVNMITRKRDMHAWETALSVTAIRYGDPRGSLAACAQSCRAKSLGLGLRSPTNSTEVNSALSIQSSSPRFCTKTEWGPGSGPRLGGRDQGAGAKGLGQGQGVN